MCAQESVSYRTHAVQDAWRRMCSMFDGYSSLMEAVLYNPVLTESESVNHCEKLHKLPTAIRATSFSCVGLDTFDLLRNHSSIAF